MNLVYVQMMLCKSYRMSWMKVVHMLVAYKYMHEVQQEEQGSACAENRTPREVRLYFKRGPD